MRKTALRLWAHLQLWLHQAPRMELEFAEPQRRSRAMALYLLAGAAFVLAVVLWHSDQTEQENVKLEAALQVEGGGQKRERKRTVDPISSADLDDKVRKANRVIRQFAAPWEDVFGTIESVNTDHVALLSLESDPANGQVRVGAEARNFKKMLEYLERLRQDGRLSPAVLQSHQIMVDDPSHPVRFTFTASWTSAKKAPK